MNGETIENTDVIEAVKYVAKSQNGWGIPMIGIEAEDGSNLDHAGIVGLPMTDFKIDGTLVKKVRVRNARGKWLPYGVGLDGKTGIGNGSEITGIEIVGSGLMFAVHVMGGQWLNPVKTSDVEGEILVGVGATIDAIWIDEI